MKILIASFFTLFAISTFACQPEAQVAFRIQKIKKNETSCSLSFSLDVSRGDVWNSSVVCPIFYEDVEMPIVIEDKEFCTDKKSGDKISGILIPKGENIYVLE